jgi:type IV pilus assembly protein PilA
MKVCPACAHVNEDSAAFCNQCGTSLPATAYVPPQPAMQSPAKQHPAAGEISGLAIASLVCGFLFFIFPAALLAIVFGHVASSQIRKSAGRLKGAGMSLAGMILGYAGLALVVVILLIAAFAIPNLTRPKMAANEASAVSNLRDIARAAIQYQDAYHGYPPALSALGPPPDGHAPDADGADLIGARLTSGSKNGYTFQYHAVSSRGDGVFDGFDANADPITPGTTGARHFHIDESGVIRVWMSAPAGRDSPLLK